MNQILAETKPEALPQFGGAGSRPSREGPYTVQERGWARFQEAVRISVC